MKRLLIPSLIILLTGCFASYPTTSFWMSNHSNKTINFKASIVKYSSMGPFEMTLPFMIKPKDSVLVRQVGFRPDGNPARIFTNISFFPMDSVKFNNPQDSVYWKKSIDAKGQTKFTFHIFNQK